MIKTGKFHIPFNVLVLVSIVIISAAMHARHMDKDLMGLHVWRQAETQSTINNFHDEDMNILNPRRNARGNGEGYHRMEFPLMQWLVAASYKIFGSHILITRLFMFITGLFSVFGMYKLIRYLLKDDIPALVGAWAFNFSPSFYYYTINPLPDNFALCFAIWGIAMFFLWTRERKVLHIILSGLFLSIAALSKLPFVLYFSVPMAYFLFATSRKPQATSGRPQAACHSVRNSLAFFGIYLLFTIPVVAWYVYVIPGWQGNGVIKGILENKASASVLLDNFRHHLFITSTELLLNYGSVPLFLAGTYFVFREKKYREPIFILLGIWVMALIMYFLFELNMIGKSHDYYLLPFLPALFIVVGFGFRKIYSLHYKWVKAILFLLLISLPVIAALRIDNRWNPDKPGFNKDFLVYKDDLRNAIPDNGLCVAGNDPSYFIMFYYIDKMGWGFDSDNLGEKNLKKMIRDGASYLYSDSRLVDEHEWIKPLLEEKVGEFGSVRVYRLKQGFQP